MKEHKHAAVLRAIADGVPMREFEVRNKDWNEDNWVLLEIYLVESLIYYEEWEVRRIEHAKAMLGIDPESNHE